MLCQAHLYVGPAVSHLIAYRLGGSVVGIPDDRLLACGPERGRDVFRVLGKVCHPVDFTIGKVSVDEFEVLVVSGDDAEIRLEIYRGKDFFRRHSCRYILAPGVPDVFHKSLELFLRAGVAGEFLRLGSADHDSGVREHLDLPQDVD